MALSNDIERLAVAQAFYKVAGGIVGTKDPDSLRALCDYSLERDYTENGIKSRDILINGKKCGTYSVKIAKEVSKEETYVIDPAELDDFIVANEGLAVEFAKCYSEKFAEFVNLHYGLEPDGCLRHIAVTSEHYAGTVLKVDPDKVVEAYGGSIGESLGRLLGGAK